MYNKQQVLTASGINVIAGLWLIAAPFIFGYSNTASSANDIVLGLIIAIFALIRFYAPAHMTWLSWINAVLGLWLIISPFALGFQNAFSFWNDIVLGLVVTFMAIWSSSAAQQQSKGV